MVVIGVVVCMAVSCIAIVRYARGCSKSDRECRTYIQSDEWKTNRDVSNMLYFVGLALGCGACVAGAAM